MIVVGEKINATRSSVKPVIQDRDSETLIRMAKCQETAGATFIDVNVATGIGSQDEEVSAMKWAVEIIQDHIEIPICLDSADPLVIEAGVRAINGDGFMINSTKAERESLDAVVPLAVEKSALLVALTMDESGIPRSVAERLQAGEKIVEACEKYGMSMKHVYLDPLVLPLSTDIHAGATTLETIRALKNRFPGVNTITGLSNISFGLPERGRLNVAFILMGIYAGLDAAIVDPLDQRIMDAIKTGEAVVGKDRHCRRYLRAFRK